MPLIVSFVKEEVKAFKFWGFKSGQYVVHAFDIICMFNYTIWEDYESDRTSERDLFGVKSLLRQPITPTMTNIYINFVIFLKHENFLKYEKILNCHGNVEMLTYNWLRMKISINPTMHIVK